MGKLEASRIKFKHLWPLFGSREKALPKSATSDEEMKAQLVRLIVLFEDMRIETHGSGEKEVAKLDENGCGYRQIYFLRRGFATIQEIAGAIRVLQVNAAFKNEIARHFTPEDREKWHTAVQFFRAEAKFIKRQRNLYGGHFHDEAALFVVRNLSVEHVDKLEVYFLSSGKIKVVFRFALEFVGVGITAGKGAQNYQEFIPESLEKLTKAHGHAAEVVLIISKHYIMPWFGFTKTPIAE